MERPPFFLRQEAAKRIRDLEPILPFTEDRHLGQILVRRLNRQDDAAYLEGLIARTPYLEVQRAAAAQLTLLRKPGLGARRDTAARPGDDKGRTLGQG